MAPKWNKPAPKNKNETFKNPTKEIADKAKADFDFVKFSFKYLVSNNPLYKYQDKDPSYFLSFVSRLKNISAMECRNFRINYQRTLRNHYINWEDTTQTQFGIPNEDQLVDRPFQFGISVNEHGRIIGFFIENTFHIVWFDPEHNTYS